MRVSPLLRYLEALTCTQGEGAGAPLRVLPWQRKFLRGVFGTDGDSALSIARGAGKSTLLAGVASAFLDGPLRIPRAEVVLVASSFAQARIAFSHARYFLGAKLEDRKVWRVSDSEQSATIIHRPSGAMMRAVGSDFRRAHGLAPALALLDEPAQWIPSTADRMLASLRTGLGKVPNSRLVAIGTRSESATHWFSKMLAGGAAFATTYAASPEDNPFHRRTWAKANPSLRYFPSLLRRYELEAQEARSDPEKLASFKALRLNLGTPDTTQSSLITPERWAEIEGEAERAGDYVMGVDLGTSGAMSALAAYWPETGRLESLAAFPEIPPLLERGQQDGVSTQYEQMHARGELLIAGRRASDVGELLREARRRWGHPSAVVCDAWRQADLIDALEREGMWSEVALRRQGFKDGAEDVRSFREAVATERVRPMVSLLMTAAMSEARTVCDPAGNEKLAKNTEGGRRARARDDAAAAAILAVGAGYRWWKERSQSRGVYLGAV